MRPLFCLYLFWYYILIMDRKKFWSLFLLGSMLIAVFVILWNGSATIPAIWRTVTSVLYPIIGGIVIAFIISIPAAPIRRALSKHMGEKSANMLSAAISAIIIMLLAAIIISLIIPEFISACRILVFQLTAFASDSNFWAGIDVDSIPVIDKLIDKTPEGGIALSASSIEWLAGLRNMLITITIDTISGAVSFIALFFVSLVFAFYFLMNKNLLKKDGYRVFGHRIGAKATGKLKRIVSAVSISFSRFAVAQAMEAVIIGSICFIGMLIFRMPYAAAVSAFTALMSLIPIYGAVIGALAGAFIIAVSEPIKGLAFLVFIFILQQLEGDFIYPRVVGTSTGLPPIYVFAAVTFGGILFGLPGMILAVPVVSSVYALLPSEDEASAGTDSESDGNTCIEN